LVDGDRREREGSCMSDICANGKVILFGEHAAVYGRPALAAGIPGGIRLLSLEPAERSIHISILPWELDADNGADGRIGEVLRLLDRLVPGHGGFDAEFEAAIPASAGMGSSAALAVALAMTLARVRGVGLSLEQVRSTAHQLEKVFHGSSSGLDDTVATYGGLCLFRRNGWGVREPGVPGFERINSCALRVPCRELTLLVGNCGVEHSTREMVAGVGRRRREDERFVEEIFDEIEACLDAGLQALCTADGARLGRAMLANHQALCRLGVSCSELDEMVDLAVAAGAGGAKLTGAGGGGGVVAHAAGCEDEVLDAWRRRGFSGKQFTLAEGAGAWN